MVKDLEQRFDAAMKKGEKQDAKAYSWNGREVSKKTFEGNAWAKNLADRNKTKFGKSISKKEHAGLVKKTDSDLATSYKRSTSDGYMTRKLPVKHEDTSKDSARLSQSKTKKNGEVRFGGRGAKII